MYVRFLGNSFYSPGTIKNYISGAKSWVDHHLGSSVAFAAQEAGDVLKRVGSSLNHTTCRTYPLSLVDIKTICSFLDARPSAPVSVKACILLAYASFLRASNLTSPSMAVWGGAHTLRAGDIIESTNGLILVIRSTKTIHQSTPTLIQIQPAESSSLCPVHAWKVYKQQVNPWPFGPAFLYDDVRPLTPLALIALMKLALKDSGHPFANNVTMHSLQRGGTQCAASNGATQNQLLAHGTWKSKSGLQPYITDDQRIVPQIIADSLAN